MALTCSAAALTTSSMTIGRDDLEAVFNELRANQRARLPVGGEQHDVDQCDSVGVHSIDALGAVLTPERTFQ